MFSANYLEELLRERKYFAYLADPVGTYRNGPCDPGNVLKGYLLRHICPCYQPCVPALRATRARVTREITMH